MVEPAAARARWLGAVALSGIVALSGASLALQLRDQTRVPETETVREANAIVAAGLHDGDVIRHRPLWFDAARLGLPDAHFLMSRELDPYDRHRFRRMWVLSATSYAAQAATDALWLGPTEVPFERDGYRVEVGPIVQTETVLWDALLELEHAEISRIATDGTESRCDTWENGRWYCGAASPFLFVGRGMPEMDDTPRECVTVNALEHGEAWAIRWPELEIGSILRVRAGNTDVATRLSRGAPVIFEVRLDDQVLHSHEYAIDEYGYPEMVADTSARADERGTIEFRVQAADPIDRFFCFRAQVVR